MNVRFGTSKTVHNTLSICVERVDGELVKTPVPTCSVAFHGKERHETTDPITCKTCAKRVIKPRHTEVYEIAFHGRVVGYGVKLDGRALAVCKTREQAEAFAHRAESWK